MRTAYFTHVPIVPANKTSPVAILHLGDWYRLDPVSYVGPQELEFPETFLDKMLNPEYRGWAIERIIRLHQDALRSKTGASLFNLKSLDLDRYRLIEIIDFLVETGLSKVISILDISCNRNLDLDVKQMEEVHITRQLFPNLQLIISYDIFNRVFVIDDEEELERQIKRTSDLRRRACKLTFAGCNLNQFCQKVEYSLLQSHLKKEDKIRKRAQKLGF